jgi:MFS family permease
MTVLPDSASAGETARWRPPFALFIAGLSLKQVLAWGTTYYLPSILERQIGAELGLQREVIFGGVTLMLLVAAALAPAAGRYIDKHGAHRPMVAGALALSLGLSTIGMSQGAMTYLAGWALFGLAVPLTMSVAAFAAVTQAFPERGRAGITTMMLFGGLSSGVIWPLTGWLDSQYGWRMTCMIYALLQVAIALPVSHWLIAPSRRDAATRDEASVAPRLPEASRQKAYWLLVIGVGVSGLVSWGLPLYFVPMFRDSGFAPAIAILLAAMQAYFTTAARLVDLGISARVGGMRLVSSSAIASPVVFLLLLWGLVGLPSGAAQLALVTLAMAIYGFCTGMISAGRATLPLELFGSSGFATTLGRLSRWFNVIFAFSPLVFAALYDRWGAEGALMAALVLSLAAGIAFWRLDGLVRHGPQG